MSPGLLRIREGLRPVIKAALDRGVKTNKELEVIISVELALHGLRLSSSVLLTTIPAAKGMDLRIEFGVEPVERPPAKIYALKDGKALRRCEICEGVGCLWCRDQGWLRIASR